MTTSCSVCAKVNARFHYPPKTHLIKETQPMDRLSLDFKGPIALCTQNRYMLTVVDEDSRLPFDFSCSSKDANTVITVHAYQNYLQCLIFVLLFTQIEGLLLCLKNLVLFCMIRVLVLVERTIPVEMASVKNLMQLYEVQ